MKQKILVINGPNLNLLGTREKDKYGKQSLEDIKKNCETHCKNIGLELEFKQSNVEGEIVNFIQSAQKNFNGIKKPLNFLVPYITAFGPVAIGTINAKFAPRQTGKP